MRVHFVMHEAFEAPGAFASWCQARGHRSTYSRVYESEALPASAEDIDLLVVLGGPQSPATTLLECPHFDAMAEQRLIRRCIEAGRAVIGVCLGSQLIGEALGAAFVHSPEKEIGAFPIVLTEAGRANAKFRHFADREIVGHWHNDMPGLTTEAVVIAKSEGCPRQIVEYAPLVYGFQCHLEFDLDTVEQLISASEAALPALKGARFVQQPDELRRNDYNGMNQILMLFLDLLVEHLQIARKE